MSAGNQPGPRARCTFSAAGQQQFWLPEKGQGKVAPVRWSVIAPGFDTAAGTEERSQPFLGLGARLLRSWARVESLLSTCVLGGTRVEHLTMAKVAGVMVLNDPS